MNIELFQWWKIGSTFGAGAGFLAVLGSCLGMFMPKQPVETALEKTTSSEQRVMSSLLLAHLESGDIDSMFCGLDQVSHPVLRAYLVDEVGAHLEVEADLQRLGDIAAETTSAQARSAALTSVAFRQVQLGFDSSKTRTKAQAAATEFVEGNRSVLQLARYRLGANRGMWPLLFAVIGSAFAVAFGLFWKLPKINRRRRKRIGFSQA